MTAIFDPLTLPNGAIIPNRLAKAAMEENLAGAGQVPDDRLFTLYRRWSEGGAGLLITGNVMVDARAMTGPGGVVLDAHSPLEPFRAWSEAAHAGGARVWMQISHPGRQVEAAMPGVALAPSAIRVDIGSQSKRFAVPKEMTEQDIAEVIEMFATTARLAEETGFDGVEIHGAHGYLLSQFLSPISNRRLDGWGGDIAARSRLLLAVVRAVRAAVSPGFTVAVKLNSADFQRGGFDERDARAVIEMLNREHVDLVELSGGSYESPAMSGHTSDARTLAREAYFLTFAQELLDVAAMPLMVTGGITRREVAEVVIGSGVAIAGMATALAYAPTIPRDWRENRPPQVSPKPVQWKNKTFAAVASMALVKDQMMRITDGRPTRAGGSPILAIVKDQLRGRAKLARYAAWLPTHPAGKQLVG
ncbi:NADH:flavin oxidoreductase/NADH oxidase family protein [Mycobacteriaceae bacterium NPDC060252]